MYGKASVNGVMVLVTSESTNESVNVPRQPLEEGISLTDHVEQQAESLSLSGVLVRDTPEETEQMLAYLRDYMNIGILVNYEYRRIYTNMLISSFNYDADASVANGFNISLSLTKARITESNYTPATKPTTNAGKQQTQNQQEQEVYHVTNPGTTYYDLEQKYGTPWQQIQEWAGYDPKSLPVGEKIRVA